MVEIRLRNSLTRKVEPLEPTVRAGEVSMYVCGPTVYDRAHLGNARPVVVFDVLYRLLRHVYGEGHVTYVRNITDVDDRINETARARKAAGAEGTLEDLIHERAEETIRWYHEDMDALGCLPPDFEPRATEHIGGMIAMIETLIAKGHAYAAEGHVLFSVDSYAAYGRLSGRSVEDMIAGARVEVAPYKKNPMDFVLWKPSDDDLPGWDSPWGRGRPGWHIECSAMSRALLGESFDIHGGGIDLQFPHHENEIAQSCCAHPEAGFARIWLHNEMLQVEGKKMSKSLGNFFTVRDLLDQGVPGEVIRFVMLSTHYSKPMDWTQEKRWDAEKQLDELARALRSAVQFGETPKGDIVYVPKGVQESLAKDLNTYDALRSLFSAADTLEKTMEGSLTGSPSEAAATFITGLDILGFYTPLLGRMADLDSKAEALAPLETKATLEYNLAKQNKDFARIDALKAALIDAGVEVRMSKTRVDLVPGPNFDPAKLENLH